MIRRKKDKLLEDKEYLYLAIAGLVFTLILFVLSFLYMPGERLYYKTNMALFIMCVINVTLFFKSYSRIKKLFLFLRYNKRKEKLKVGDWADLTLVLIYSLTLITLAFLVDWEIFSSSKVKVGTVVIISFINLILHFRKAT